MATKKGDFVEVTFVGKEKESGKVFDTNDPKEAKSAKLNTEEHHMHALNACIGQQDVIKGLDEAFEGKELNKNYSVDIPMEKAFGKKDAKLYQLVSAAKFKQQKIDPYPGLVVTSNNMNGVIKTVSGGRVMVDFNHPLAGKDLHYDFTITRIIADDREKLESTLHTFLGLHRVKVDVKEGNAEVAIELPEPLALELEKKLKERIPSLKSVKFQEMKKEEKKAPKTE